MNESTVKKAFYIFPGQQDCCPSRKRQVNRKSDSLTAAHPCVLVDSSPHVCTDAQATSAACGSVFVLCVQTHSSNARILPHFMRAKVYNYSTPRWQI